MSDFPSAPPPMGMSSGVPATFAQRLIAVLIDAGLVLAMFIPVVIIAVILGAIADVLALIGLLLYLAVIAAALYMIIGGIGMTGQTPGKRMQGIKVVNSTGETIGVGGSVVRYIVQYFTNAICYIGGLWMLFDADKKTLYDKILDNQVIQVEKGGVMPIFPNGNPI